MRHRKTGLKLNRTSSHRTAMFRNMVTSLFKHERIRTTDVKAKELRRWADNLITMAKRGDLHARRQALSIVREKEVVYKLFAEAAKRYGSVSGGYTRIVKLGRRPGDAAPISLIELVFSEERKKKKKTKKKAKGAVEKKQVAEKKEAEEKRAEEQKEAATKEKATEKKKDMLDKEKDVTEEKEAEVKTGSTTEDSDDLFEKQAGAPPVKLEETEFKEPEVKDTEDDAGDSKVKE
ncbi:MAG: 50S ribosomal protein L17 [Deltaproteobacteria bacterium]|nr:MAG: 50S ribosomal protein L17 [Deltaproteobacteria bacterium]